MLRRSSSLLIAVLAMVTPGAQADEPLPLQLVQTIPLPDLDGRLDHLAIDLRSQHLFVAAFGHNTLEVVDLSTGIVAASLTGLRQPQGVVFIPEANQLVVANGGGGCDTFDGGSLTRIRNLPLLEDAGALRYDPDARLLYLGYGHALAVIDAPSGHVVAVIPLDGHPESFQLERSSPKLYVNVPTAHRIVVIDRHEGRAVSKWWVTIAQGNFPMALDEARHRLFVGFRSPAKLVIFDTKSGRAVDSLDLASDADDIFFDAARQRVYVSSGKGVLDVFQQADTNQPAAREHRHGPRRTHVAVRAGAWQAVPGGAATGEQPGGDPHLSGAMSWESRR